MVTRARTAHSDRTDPGHDLALGQMPVAHEPPAAIIGELVAWQLRKLETWSNIPTDTPPYPFTV